MEPGNNTNTSFELGKSGSAASGGSLLNRSWGLGLARTVQKTWLRGDVGRFAQSETSVLSEMCTNKQKAHKNAFNVIYARLSIINLVSSHKMRYNTEVCASEIHKLIAHSAR